MLDIHAIRENPDAIGANLARRRAPEKLQFLETVIAADGEWRRRLEELQDLRRHRNAVSQDIAKLLKDGKDATAAKREAAADLPDPSSFRVGVAYTSKARAGTSRRLCGSTEKPRIS